MRRSREEGGGEERRRGVSVTTKARKDSDSSSRGRMGSPSGKSHDSSDSDQSWGRVQEQGAGASPAARRRVQELQEQGAGVSPATRRRASGETRLDRLVRRPSVSALPKPRKAKAAEEPLYDTVAAEEEPESEYDNHLLYGEQSLASSTDPASPERRRRETEEEGNYVNIQYFLSHTQVGQGSLAECLQARGGHT